MVPLGLAEAAGAELGWPLHVIEGAAHAPQIEQPEGFLQFTYDKEETRA